MSLNGLESCSLQLGLLYDALCLSWVKSPREVYHRILADIFWELHACPGGRGVRDKI